jgi:hypothetical protein
MPSQDEIMQKICDLVTKGAGVELSDDDKTELHNRYYVWIAKKKNGAPTSPQEIWETGDGEKIQRQFEKIGREMTHQKKLHLKVAAAMVERLSDCPHCPDPPSG